VKMLRDEVAEMFGDWGVGRLGGAGAGGMNGTYLSLHIFSHAFRSAFWNNLF
jgi:hypothetical protein